MPKANSSPLWKYFQIDEDISYANCILCKKKLSRGNKNPRKMTTSGLRNHLKNRHRLIYDELAPALSKATEQVPTKELGTFFTKWTTKFEEHESPDDPQPSTSSSGAIDSIPGSSKQVSYSKMSNEAENNVVPNNDGNEVADALLHKMLMEMGMDKTLSEKALIKTKNKSVEAALDWIAELGAEEMEALCGDSEEEYTDDGEEESEGEEIYYKMVFVVNSQLGMGTGKIASQVGHACLGLYRNMIQDKGKKYEASLEEWEIVGEKKITLKGKDADHLHELQKKAETNDLPTYMVQDAGRTQIPDGSYTILALFGDEETVNDVTGGLRLL